MLATPCQSSPHHHAIADPTAYPAPVIGTRPVLFFRYL